MQAPLAIELDDLGAHRLGDSHKIGVTRCVDKLLPGKRCQLGFIVGESQRGNVGNAPTGSIGLWGGLQLTLLDSIF